jgi:hypothetical protein
MHAVFNRAPERVYGESIPVPQTPLSAKCTDWPIVRLSWAQGSSSQRDAEAVSNRSPSDGKKTKCFVGDDKCIIELRNEKRER